jgi:hypothetical protein
MAPRAADTCTPTCGHAVVGDLLTRWTATRQVLAELEAAEHPDITDTRGRTWAWWKDDLYRHDRKAWPREFIEAAT